MSASFSRGPRGTLVVRFEESDAALLQTLLTQLLELLDADDPMAEDADPLSRALGIGVSTTPPADPALARLFPDAYTDAEDAAEFRRYTESDLRVGKRTHVRTALATLERDRRRLSLSPEEASAWLGSLNDLRLTLGTRLGITDDDDDPSTWFAQDDPRQVLVPIYFWLGWLQETLIESLM